MYSISYHICWVKIRWQKKTLKILYLILQYDVTLSVQWVKVKVSVGRENQETGNVGIPQHCVPNHHRGNGRRSGKEERNEYNSSGSVVECSHWSTVFSQVNKIHSHSQQDQYFYWPSVSRETTLLEVIQTDRSTC